MPTYRYQKEYDGGVSAALYLFCFGVGAYGFVQDVSHALVGWAIADVLIPPVAFFRGISWIVS